MKKKRKIYLFKREEEKNKDKSYQMRDRGN